MITACDCRVFSEVAAAYVDKKLDKDEMAAVNEHLVECAACRDTLRLFREVHVVLSLSQAQSASATGAVQPVAEPQSRFALLGSAPWWMVSLVFHMLIIALAGLVTMAIEMPHPDDSVIMMTELQPRAVITSEEEKKKEENLARDLQSKLDAPPTDKDSNVSSDIVIPPDILAKAELGDHFETINPDRPDTHSAYGNEESTSFHSVSGNAEPPGGGGMGGMSMEDVIGIGGGASRGKGGGFGGGDGTGVGIGTGSGRGTFGNRNGGGRKLMVKINGGSKATENAVDSALDWLARHQEADGHWLPSKYSGGIADGTSETGATGLALLAFLGAGHTEKTGKYKANVQRAVSWFIANQIKGGKNDGMYCKMDNSRDYGHAIATMAMSEAAGMARMPETIKSAQKGVDCISNLQVRTDPDGYEREGWEYHLSNITDTSVTSWMCLACKSAKVAGLHVDPLCFEGTLRWLDATQPTDQYKLGCMYRGTIAEAKQQGFTENSKLVYNNVTGPQALVAASGLMRMYMGLSKDEPRIQTTGDFLLKKLPEWKPNGKTCFYHLYYGTLCMFMIGGDGWKQWNKALKDALLPNQCKGGDDDGSWDPNADWLCKYGGRVYSTAMGALCMEVYYRYAKIQPDK